MIWLMAGSPEIPPECVLDLLFGGSQWARPQQSVHAHDESGGAEAALRAVRPRQGLLDRVEALTHVADTCADNGGKHVL